VLIKDDRLRLVEICCKIKLNRNVTLAERIWMFKLTMENEDAVGIKNRFLG
jgi:predicted RNA polymerase sigma factor